MMTLEERRTFGPTSSRLCGQLNTDTTYLGRFGEVKDEDPSNHRRRGEFVVCVTSTRKIDILEIDNGLGQTN